MTPLNIRTPRIKVRGALVFAIITFIGMLATAPDCFAMRLIMGPNIFILQDYNIERNKPTFEKSLDIENPYGNPYNSYLRQPFGVLPKKKKNIQPVIDNSQKPFSYYRTPRAALGVFGGIENTMITPEGDLRNDFGTLLFFVGTKLTPLDVRIKTWKYGWQPVAELYTKSDGITYHLEYFDYAVDGITKVPASISYGLQGKRKSVTHLVNNIITFVKITATNTTNDKHIARFGVRLGKRTVLNPVFRGKKRPKSIEFNRSDLALSKGDDLLLLTSVAPTEVLVHGKRLLSYQKVLDASSSYSVILKLPYWIAKTRDLKKLKSYSYSKALIDTESFWKRKLSHTVISVPEPKVENTYKASVVQLLDGGLNIIGDYWFETANPEKYKYFHVRDAAFHLNATLEAGFPNIVKHVLESYRVWQKSDGRYVYYKSPNEYDSNGEALWTLGRYYLLTHDLSFAHKLFPSIKASMAWQWNYRKANWSTSDGLYPINHIGDDEQVRGHIVGFNLWSIAGGKAAVSLASGIEDVKDASIWSSRMKQYLRILKSKLSPEFKQLHVISPAIEGIHTKAILDGWYGPVYGIDWGNLQLVWPGEVFNPRGSMVLSSLRVWRNKMFEGIFGYPMHGVESFLHSYQPVSIPEAALRGGDQLDAIRYLYNELAHTSSMDMATEGINAAGRWGWRTTTDTMPHNEFSAEYVSLLRDILAYGTYEGNLYLANVYSPYWTEPGKAISFSGPTRFGNVSYKIKMTRNGMLVHLTPPTRNRPTRIVISTPQDTKVTSVRVAGNRAHINHVHVRTKGNHIMLPGKMGPITLDVSWHRTGTPPPYSFHRAVQDLLADYHQMTQPLAISVKQLTVRTGGSGKGSNPSGVHSVQEGVPVAVSALLVNRGGAGWPKNPVITLYEDGEPSQTNRTILAKGIGFNTPSQVISFRHHMEGRVPVTFTTTFHESGRHTVGIAFGAMRPVHSITINVGNTQPTGSN